MKKILFLAPLFLALAARGAEITEISLDMCEKSATENSYEIKSYRSAVSAAEHTYKGSKSSYYPSIYFDASGSWVSEIPELEIMNQTMSFGDNWGYSAGPTLEYTLFDYGGRTGAAKSALAALNAANNNLDFAQKTVLLNVRQAYFSVQQDLDRVYFLSEQLAVAAKQLSDVNSAFKAGSKSRLDVAMAEKQRLKALVGVSSARSALGVHIRELLRIAAIDLPADLSYPSDWRVSADKEDAPASVLIKADSLLSTLDKFNAYQSYDFNPEVSKITAAENMAEYYKYLAESYDSALYPRVNLGAGAYFEYPNGPIKENVFLGRVGATFRFPLFEGSKTRSQAGAQKSLSEQAEYQKLDITKTLQRMFYSAKSMLYSLKIQTEITKKMISASDTAARLTYDAYKAGSVTFLEVDSANLNLLESKINLADIYVDMLNSLATADYLGRELI